MVYCDLRPNVEKWLLEIEDLKDPRVQRYKFQTERLKTYYYLDHTGMSSTYLNYNTVEKHLIDS